MVPVTAEKSQDGIQEGDFLFRRGHDAHDVSIGLGAIQDILTLKVFVHRVDQLITKRRRTERQGCLNRNVKTQFTVTSLSI